MKRRWNVALWAGFLVVLSAPVLYGVVFVRFPATRDYPWAPLLIFGAGFTLMARALGRAYREPQLYRGRIAGTILLGLGVALFGFLGFNLVYLARQLPSSQGAPQVGGKAPDFTLPDEDGHPVTLSRLLEPDTSGGNGLNGVVLIFYRGFW
jgi:hypothetical protein